MTRGAEQAEADGEHAGDAAGAERDLERRGQRAGLAPPRRCARCPGWPGVMPMKPVRPGQEAAGDERQRAEQARLRRTSAPRRRPASRTSVEVRNTIAATGIRITAIVLNCRREVGRGAFLDRQRDLDHLRRALVGGEDAAHQHGSRRRWPMSAAATDSNSTGISPPPSTNS